MEPKTEPTKVRSETGKAREFWQPALTQSMDVCETPHAAAGEQRHPRLGLAMAASSCPMESPGLVWRHCPSRLMWCLDTLAAMLGLTATPGQEYLTGAGEGATLDGTLEQSETCSCCPEISAMVHHSPPMRTSPCSHRCRAIASVASAAAASAASASSAAATASGDGTCVPRELEQAP